MFLDGLDELDQKIIHLLIKNARMSYSDIGQQIGISRVAVKMRIQVSGTAGHYRRIYYNHKPAENQRCRILLFRNRDTAGALWPR